MVDISVLYAFLVVGCGCDNCCACALLLKHVFMDSSLQIVLMGKGGCGKGTQSRLLAEELGLLHVVTSKIILETIPLLPDEEREKYQAIYDSGDILPSRVVAGWLASRLMGIVNSQDGYVLDGSPRRIQEAEELKDHGLDWTKVKVFWIEISDEIAYDRMKTRRECARCKLPIPNFPEYEDDTVCRECGGELVQRLNDPDVIKKRLEAFHHDTFPVRRYFEELGVLTSIDGDQSIEGVHNDMLQHLGIS